MLPCVVGLAVRQGQWRMSWWRRSNYDPRIPATYLKHCISHWCIFYFTSDFLYFFCILCFYFSILWSRDTSQQPQNYLAFFELCSSMPHYLTLQYITRHRMHWSACPKIFKIPVIHLLCMIPASVLHKWTPQEGKDCSKSWYFLIFYIALYCNLSLHSGIKLPFNRSLVRCLRLYLCILFFVFFVFSI